MTFEDALGVHLRRLDKTYADLRACCADPKHLNNESSELKTAVKLFTESAQDCFKLKNAWKLSEDLSKEK